MSKGKKKSCCWIVNKSKNYSNDAEDGPSVSVTNRNGSSSSRNTSRYSKEHGKSMASSKRRSLIDSSDEEDNNDSFKRDHRQQMNQIDSMFRDPFGAMGGGMLGLPAPGRNHRRHQQQGQNMTVAERGTFMDPFSHFDSMFSNMRSMMTDMHRSFDSGSMMSNGNGQVFQQSSVTTYTNTGNGAPKIYQATSSSRSGPGGIKETRRTVRDSERGIEKISVGHHINDRAHVIERSRRQGEMSENQEYINLDEEEAPTFDREYQEKWGRHAMRGLDDRRRAERERHAPIGNRHRQQALPEPKSQRPRKSSQREN